MKKAVFAVVAALMLGNPVFADTKDEVTGVIQSQIEAFLADDFATAFTFAAPGIKRMFGNPDRFGLMVRQGYPMVWRPADVQYLDLRTEPTGPVQRVLIKDRAGATHLLEYYMIETETGWQISGVQLLPSPGIGA